MLHKSLWSAMLAAWLVAQAVALAGRGPTELRIDSGESRVTILVGKAGMLSFAGHAHEVVAPAVRGRVTFDPMDWPHASVSLEFDAAALRVTGKDEAASDVPAVEKTMLGAQVLDVEHFPLIAFQSRRVSVVTGAAAPAALTIDGDMTLHGKTRPMTIRARASVDASGRVTATGAFTLKQTDFGIVPVTAAGGTIRVKDDIDIQFVLKASPGNGTTNPADVRRCISCRWFVAVASVCAVLAPAWSTTAAAQMQMVMPPTEQLAFTRPESWVLAHFDAATLLSGLPTPSAKPWSIAAGLELGWLPPLDATQRRVGFNGTEEEDLNKSPVMPRIRVTIGLPARFSAIVGFTPPVTMFGVRASLLALGLERPLVEEARWTLGLRGYGQFGSVRGDYTCPTSVVAFEPGSPGNPDGCNAPSSDVAKLRYVGGEATFEYRPKGSGRLSPHAALGLSYMDVGFQVDALTFGFADHTSYLSHGTVLSVSGGVNYRISSRFAVGLDAFYAPLSVRRGAGQVVEHDGLFNVRAMVVYRIR